MRLTLLTLLVVGTAAMVVSAQNNNRREARARLRALAQAARSGDVAAQDLLKARRRQRPRHPTQSSAVPARPVFQDAVETPVATEAPIRVRVPVRRTRVRVPRPTVQEVTTFRPTTLFSLTPAPETTVFDTEQSIFDTVPFTEAPFFEPTVPVTEAPVFRNVIEQTPVPTRTRFRPQSRPVDDFSINFDLEPHRALQTGLEVGTRSEHIIPRFGNDRTTEPPVETINRYSYFDDQGNYVFGYEAADGSFKEEVRGLDCVVNGKYGYVDPDGIRREFTYTSGNKCDPNAVVDPETQEVPVLPLNEQFLQQTQEQQLTEAELDQLHFTRRRQPVQNTQPQQQTVRSNNRRQQPQTRPSARPTSRPAPRPTPRPTARPAPRPSARPAPRPIPRPVQRPQPVFEPEPEILATPAPAPVFRPPSFKQAQEGRFPPREPEVRQPQPQEQPQSAFAPEEQLIRRAPQPRPQPSPQQRPQSRPQLQQRPQPRPQPQQRPQPQPRPQPQQRPQPQLRPQPQQRPQPQPRPQEQPQSAFAPEEQFIRRPQPTRAPVQEQNTRQSTHTAFVPPEGPSFRPTPKPINFDFDREFNNLFNNFAAPRPTTRRPVFTPTARPSPRPTPPPTSRPPPPPPPPRTQPTFTPVTRAPVTSRPSLDDGSQTLGGGRDVANQLVFDSASGTFTNVKVNTGTNRFLPQQAPNPFAPRPSQSSPPAPNPFSAPRTAIPSPPNTHPSTVGRPLPLPTQASGFNPASHFVINQNGRSPAAAEFDKFFSQFNLQF